MGVIETCIHLYGVQVVGGSNPLAPTKQSLKLMFQAFLYPSLYNLIKLILFIYLINISINKNYGLINNLYIIIS